VLCQAGLEEVKLACVSIMSVYGTGENAKAVSGSGFIVSGDGYIVTNAHLIISNDIRVTVKIGKHPHEVTAGLYYLDDLLDIAILKVQLGGLSHIGLGDDENLKLGQRLFAVGSPLVFTDIFTDGIYSAYNEYLGMIQHTAELSRGNSGGPLVTEEGEVVGVNTVIIAIPGESRYYFAVPSHVVKAVLDGLYAQPSLIEIEINADERIKAIEDYKNDEPEKEEKPEVSEPKEKTTELIVDSVPGSVSDASNVLVTPEFVSDLVAKYPDNWNSYSSSRFSYVFELPSFIPCMQIDPKDFITLDFYAFYENEDDPMFAAVPGLFIYIGFPSNESFYQFKKRIWLFLESSGFVRDKDFEKEDYFLSIPGLEFDCYWFIGEYGGEYSNLTKVLYFIRNKDDLDAYYCLDFTYNNGLGMIIYEKITFPLMYAITSTFKTLK
jgi:hypothetical protein